MLLQSHVSRSLACVHVHCAPHVRRAKHGFAWRACRALPRHGRIANAGAATMKRNTSCSALLIPGSGSTSTASPP
jgi:hypothetical protein